MKKIKNNFFVANNTLMGTDFRKNVQKFVKNSKAVKYAIFLSTKTMGKLELQCSSWLGGALM